MYRVFGYEVDPTGYVDFDVTFSSYVKAIRFFKEMSANCFTDTFFTRDLPTSSQHVNGYSKSSIPLRVKLPK